MFTLADFLATGGLGLDMVGAAIIALPDIPRIRLLLPSALIKRGLQKMETNGISEEDIEYNAIKQLLETKYTAEIPSDVWALRVGLSTMSRWGYESVFMFTDPEDESEQVALGEDLGVDVDYRVVREEIDARLNRWEATVRGSGFLLLALGFGLQIVARFA
jgi:hypothetical protein